MFKMTMMSLLPVLCCAHTIFGMYLRPSFPPSTCETSVQLTAVVPVTLKGLDFRSMAMNVLEMARINQGVTQVRETGVTIRRGQLHDTPSEEGQVVKDVPSNRNVRLTGYADGWYQVVIGEDAGWIRQRDVRRTRQFGVVSTGLTRVQDVRGREGQTVGRMDAGEPVTISRQTASWSRIPFEGENRWVRTEDLRIQNAMHPGITTANETNVYARATTSSAVRQRLPVGAQVMMLQRTTDGFVQVRIHYRRGVIRGWIEEEHLENHFHERQLTRNAPLRAEGSGQGDILKRLNPHTTVTILARVGNWYHVSTTASGSEVTGWLHRGNVSSIITTLTPADSYNILALVNRDFRLSTNFSPSDLRAVNVNSIHGTHLLRSPAATAAEALFDAARDAGFTLTATSGYRSFHTQQATHQHWIHVMGRTEAIRVSAPAGHSEHQLGLALDVSTPRIGNALNNSFSSTPEGQFVASRAHEFGFIIRYPANREADTGFVYEPWHIRYVGVQSATTIFEQGLLLEEYLGR